jgi:hypothetical protein
MKKIIFLIAGALIATCSGTTLAQADFDWQSVVKTTGSTIEATDMASGGSGIMFVAGRFSGTGQFPTGNITAANGTDVFIAKYNTTTGTCTDVATFNSTANDEAAGIAVVGGNVYLASTDGFGASSIYKIDAAMNPATKVTYPIGFVTLTDIVNGGSGLFVSGIFENGFEQLVSSDGTFTDLNASYSGKNSFVARMSSTGVFTAATVPLYSTADNVITAIFWRLNKLYATGTFSGTIDFSGSGPFLTALGAQDVFVLNMTAIAGTPSSLLWSSKVMRGGSSIASASPPAYSNTELWRDAGRDIFASNNGVYVTGHLEGQTPNSFGSYTNYAGDGAFIARFNLDAANDLVLTGTYPAYLKVSTSWTGTAEAGGYSIGADTDGNAYVTGYSDYKMKLGSFNLGGTNAPGFYAKLDLNGNVTQCQPLNSKQTNTDANYTRPNALVVSGCEVVIAGSLPSGQFAAGNLGASTSSPNRHMFVCKANRDLYLPYSITSCGPMPRTFVLNAVSSATSYSWSPGTNLSSTTIANPTFSLGSGSTNTAYTVTTTGTCPGNATVNVIAGPVQAANAGADRQLCHDESSVLGGVAGIAGISYSWSPSTYLSCVNCAQPTLTVPGTGLGSSITYTLTTTTICGNTTSDQVVVSPKPDCPRSTSANTSGMLTSQLSVYPNPTKEILYVELEGEELEEIVLRDVNGRVILSSNASETITWELNLTSFPIGMYLLEVKGKNGYRESQQVEKN